MRLRISSQFNDGQKVLPKLFPIYIFGNQEFLKHKIPCKSFPIKMRTQLCTLLKSKYSNNSKRYSYITLPKWY